MNNTIKVYFRKFSDGDVVALWPEDAGIGFISSYQHIGQHCPASPELIDELEKASQDEYQSLLDELTDRVGYDVILAD